MQSDDMVTPVQMKMKMQNCHLRLQTLFLEVQEMLTECKELSPFIKEKQTMGRWPFKAHRSFSLDGIKKEVPDQISGLYFTAVWWELQSKRHRKAFAERPGYTRTSQSDEVC